jgi:hypothetical protein
MSETMKAGEVLAKAGAVVSGDRQATHGDKRRNHDNIASLWNGYLAIRAPGPLGALDVIHMMILLKVARTQAGSLNLDDYVDAAGYAGCAAEVAQDIAAAGG